MATLPLMLQDPQRRGCHLALRREAATPRHAPAVRFRSPAPTPAAAWGRPGPRPPACPRPPE